MESQRWAVISCPVKAASRSFLAALLAAGLVACSSVDDLREIHEMLRPELRYRDANVTVTYEPKFSLNPHSESPKVLTVAGKRFPYVQGQAPYYYSFDNGRYILFSCYRIGMFSDKETLVAVDLKTKRAQSLDISDHHWGSSIYSKTADIKDAARQTAPGQVLLTRRFTDNRSEQEIRLNLRWRAYRDGRLVSQGP